MNKIYVAFYSDSDWNSGNPFFFGAFANVDDATNQISDYVTKILCEEGKDLTWTKWIDAHSEKITCDQDPGYCVEVLDFTHFTQFEDN